MMYGEAGINLKVFPIKSKVAETGYMETTISS